MLRQLDKNQTNLVTFSIFQQAASDNNIEFDQTSTEYIIH